MRRIIIGMMALSLFLAGCSSTTPQQSEESRTTEGKLLAQSTEKALEDGVLYQEDQILFAAWDRYDIEGDASKRYYYNYKGELLEGYEGKENILPYYAKVGLAPAYDRATGLYGYVDREGVFQIEPQFEYASLFSEGGLAIVKQEVEISGEEKEKIGYINSEGTFVIPCSYDYATGFHPSGYAAAAYDTGTTYMQDNGENCVPRYSEETLYECHIFDQKGNSILKLDSKMLNISNVETMLSFGLYKDYFVSDEDFYNYKGEKLAIPEEASEGFTYEYEYRNDAVYRYTYEGRGSFQDLEGMRDGRLVKIEKFNGKNFEEQELDFSLSSKRVATVSSGYGWGAEAEGKTVIPYEYDYIHKEGSYFICLKIGEDWSCQLDLYNEAFEKTAENVEYLCFPSAITEMKMPDGYFLIQSENSRGSNVYGVIDFNGNIIVEPVFEQSDLKVFTYENFGFFCY